MPRLIRNTAILAKLETTPLTDASPTGSANAILISDATFQLLDNLVDRSNLKPYLGADGQLPGARFFQCTFGVEYANSGTAGTAPAWGPLLEACGFDADVGSTPDRVEYLPVSSGMKTLTIYYNQDGVLSKALGCMGNVEFALGADERPMLRFTFWGVDGGHSATSLSSVDLSDFQTPQVITDANSGNIILGGTYSAGAISGGTAYTSRGLSLSLNNTVSQMRLLGGNRVSITQRDIGGSMQLDLTASQEVSQRADVAAVTTTSLAFSHGSGAGSEILLFAPRVQRLSPQYQDYEGEVHLSMDLRFIPTTAGNDELRIVCL